MDFAWQLDVPRAVHPQVLDGGVVGIAGGAWEPFDAPGVGRGGELADPPLELPKPKTPASIGPPDPEHPHAWSGTQVKPPPQSESTLHGRRYVGTQDLTVSVVHPPPSKTGLAQAAFGGHAGSGAGTAVQVVCVWAKQTMPWAQSLSTLHGPGMHARVSVEVHGGGDGQGPLAAHAIAGHAVMPETWQVSP